MNDPVLVVRRSRGKGRRSRAAKAFKAKQSQLRPAPVAVVQDREPR